MGRRCTVARVLLDEIACRYHRCIDLVVKAAIEDHRTVQTDGSQRRTAISVTRDQRLAGWLFSADGIGHALDDAPVLRLAARCRAEQ